MFSTLKYSFTQKKKNIVRTKIATGMKIEDQPFHIKKNAINFFFTYVCRIYLSYIWLILTFYLSTIKYAT